MQKPVFTLELDSSIMISTKVKHFYFNIKDNPDFKFVPGQFISLHFNNDDGMPIKRSYSIASIDNKQLEISATHVKHGPGTKFLFSMQPKDTVMASGPYGKLTLRPDEAQRHILIGTGTGISPYRSMLPQIDNLLSNTNDINVHIIEGVQKVQDTLYKEDFMQLLTKHKNYDFKVHYSREPELSANNIEQPGYVQQSLKNLLPDPKNDYVYLCGNPYMIEDCVQLLKELGFNTKQIIREKYFSKATEE